MSASGLRSGVGDLILQGEALSADLRSAIVSADISRNIDQASTVKLQLADPDLELLVSDVFAKRNHLAIDDLHFESVALGKSGRRLNVTFESFGIAELRKQKGPLGVVAGTLSLYELALRLIRPVPWLDFLGQPDLQISATGTTPGGTVGSPGDPKEDHWSALQRLAKAANARCFESGGTVYLGTDDWLMGNADPLTLTEATEGIDSIDFENDAGKRAGSATITTYASRWDGTPGTPVRLQGLGSMAGGDWLIESIARSLFSEQTTVTLTRKAKPPLPVVPTLTGGTTARDPVTLTVDQALALCWVAGWRGDDITYAVAVMGRESNRYEAARNLNTNGSIDRGLFQINSVAWSQITDACCFNGLCNVRAAHDTIWAHYGWGPWSSTHGPDRHFYELLREAQSRRDAGHWRDLIGSIADLFRTGPTDPSGTPFATCPVPDTGSGGGPTDSFGAPRYGGGYHLHKGSDIMADRGKPVVAPFPGRCEDDSNTLGGLALKIVGSEGYCYMAHFEQIVRTGPVTTGQIVGLVGNTGDAAGGPYHCHFEWHPNVIPPNVPKSQYGYSVIDDAINPYPYLEAVCR